MKTLTRYLVPFFADGVPLDGSLISTMIRPRSVALNNFVGFDPFTVVGNGLLPEAPPVFSRRVISETATEPTLTALTAFGSQDQNYYAVLAEPSLDLTIVLELDPWEATVESKPTNFVINV